MCPIPSSKSWCGLLVASAGQRQRCQGTACIAAKTRGHMINASATASLITQVHAILMIWIYVVLTGKRSQIVVDSFTYYEPISMSMQKCLLNQSNNDWSSIHGQPIQLKRQAGFTYMNCGKVGSKWSLVLLHTSWTAGWPFWVPLCKGWNPSFEVVALDLPGDESTPVGSLEQYTWNSLIEWVHEAIMQVTQPYQRVALLGHSVGASIVQSYLRFAPRVERVIMIGNFFDATYCELFHNPPHYLSWMKAPLNDRERVAAHRIFSLYSSEEKSWGWHGNWPHLQTLECWMRAVPLYVLHELSLLETLWMRHMNSYCHYFQLPDSVEILLIGVINVSGGVLRHYQPETWNSSSYACHSLPKCQISYVHVPTEAPRIGREYTIYPNISVREAGSSYFWGHFPWLQNPIEVQRAIQKWMET